MIYRLCWVVVVAVVAV